MPLMVLSGLGETAQFDIQTAMKKLPTQSGAQTAADLSKKFAVHSALLQKEANGHLTTLVALAGKPPTPAGMKQAVAAHNAYVAAATASGRLSIAGSYMGQAAVQRANAAQQTLNDRVINGSPALQPARASIAAAAAALNVPVAVPVNPPGTIPATGAPLAPVARPFTRQPFVPVPGTQAQVTGRQQGIGTVIPAGFAPYKGGAQLRTASTPQGPGPVMPTAPNPNFYQAGQRGITEKGAAALRAGGLNGLGGLGIDFVSYTQRAAQQAQQAANAAKQQAAAAASNAASSVTGSSAAGPVSTPDQAGQVAQAFAANLGFTANVVQSVLRNGAYVVFLQRDSDAARGSAVVDPNTGMVRSHAFPVLPADPGYSAFPGASPTASQTAVAQQTAANRASTGSSAPTGTVAPSHGAVQQPGGNNQDTSSFPTSTASVKGWWGGLTPLKKVGVGAGAALALVLGAKLAI